MKTKNKLFFLFSFRRILSHFVKYPNHFFIRTKRSFTHSAVVIFRKGLQNKPFPPYISKCQYSHTALVNKEMWQALPTTPNRTEVHYRREQQIHHDQYCFGFVRANISIREAKSVRQKKENVLCTKHTSHCYLIPLTLHQL